MGSTAQNKSYYLRNRERCYQLTKANNIKYSLRNREFVFEYLRNHPCVDCGESDPIVLEFDHVRGNKIKAVCTYARSGVSLKTLQKEINKCDVRCANCHRRKTAKEFKYFSYASVAKLNKAPDS